METSNVELRKFGEPYKWEYRAKPEKEGVETRHGEPKSEKIRLRYSPDHKQPFGW